MTSDHMKVSKGLEFSVVSLPGVVHMPAKGAGEKDAARVFYVAATRATQRLVIGVGGDGVWEDSEKFQHNTRKKQCFLKK